MVQASGDHRRVNRVCIPVPEQWMQHIEARGHGVRKEVRISSEVGLLATALHTSYGIAQTEWGQPSCPSGPSSGEFIAAAAPELKRTEALGLLQVSSSGATPFVRPAKCGMALADALLLSLLLKLEELMQSY